MGLKAGIVGLPNVGKSTLFNAITNAHVEAANYPFATINPNSGIVELNDPRVNRLVAIFNPKRTVRATFEFIDIAGLVKGASRGEGLGNQFLANIRQVDAICHVVRCFDNNEIIHLENSVNPKRDIETINIELILADLDMITKRMSKIETKAKTTKDKESVQELEVLVKLKTALENEIPARKVELTPEQQLIAKNYNLLSIKPVIYVANVSEDDYSSEEDSQYIKDVKEVAKEEGAEIIVICAQIESELVSLSEEERNEYLAALNISSTGLDQLVAAAYRLLKMQTFFTVGADEVRAWTFIDGMTAPNCAGLIHTDFERGFIRAEVYSYEDIDANPSEKTLKELGKIRSEGKTYLVKDGDCMLIRFNV